MNKLSLNIQTTHTSTFNSTYNIRDRYNHIYVDNLNIYTMNKIKFFGLLRNKKIHWCEHIKCVSNKISKNIGIIKKFTNKLDKTILLNK